MVFFTCNACGQAIKKAQVEKHYQQKCRNCEVLSCMDCGKDFYGDDYKQHTQCISENEKYGGKGYQAPQNANKGEAKQEQWLEQVRAASGAGNISSNIKNLLERIAEYPNVPRKRAKFENFVRNSLKVHNPKVMEQVWNVFSSASSKKETAKVSKSPSSASTAGMTEDISKKESITLEEEKPKKKKKKKETSVSLSSKLEGVCEVGLAGSVDNQTVDEPAKRSKKKKKKNADPEDMPNKIGDINVDAAEEIVKKSKKKKKKKKKITEEENIDVSSNAQNSIKHAVKEKKREKKKKRADPHGEVLLNDMADTNEQAVDESARKSKKKKTDVNALDGNVSNDAANLVEHSKKAKKKKTKERADSDDRGLSNGVQSSPDTVVELKEGKTKKSLKRRRTAEAASCDVNANGDEEVVVKKKAKKKKVKENGHITSDLSLSMQRENAKREAKVGGYDAFDSVAVKKKKKKSDKEGSMNKSNETLSSSIGGGEDIVLSKKKATKQKVRENGHKASEQLSVEGGETEMGPTDALCEKKKKKRTSLKRERTAESSTAEVVEKKKKKKKQHKTNVNLSDI